MFDLIFNPKKAERRPVEMLLIAFIYSSFSIFFGIKVFYEYTSVAIVFLTVLSCMYVIQGIFRKEESQELDYKSESWLLKRHKRTVIMLLFLFVGFVFSFAFWGFVLPNEQVNLIFGLQHQTIQSIRSLTSTGFFANPSSFWIILNNNLKVLLVSIVFALFYGAGVIYVIVWNASIMGLVIGTLAKNTLGVVAFPGAFLKYFVHGLPEMLAYLIAALSGGILYVALLKGDLFKEGMKKRILIDIVVLISFSIVLLILSALLEVYVSPLI